MSMDTDVGWFCRARASPPAFALRWRKDRRCPCGRDYARSADITTRHDDATTRKRSPNCFPYRGEKQPATDLTTDRAVILARARTTRDRLTSSFWEDTHTYPDQEIVESSTTCNLRYPSRSGGLGLTYRVGPIPLYKKKKVPRLQVRLWDQVDETGTDHRGRKDDSARSSLLLSRLYMYDNPLS